MLISVSDVKAKGVSFIGKLIKKHKEVFITVRGKKNLPSFLLKSMKGLKRLSLIGLFLKQKRIMKKAGILRKRLKSISRGWGFNV